MSDFLLQKSCKLLQENKRIKKSKSLERLKKKRNLNLRKRPEEEFQNNILVNLRKLEELNQIGGVDVSDKVLSKHSKWSTKEQVKEGEEEKEEEEEEGGSSTVFTEKDFEDFEKEYFEI